MMLRLLTASPYLFSIGDITIASETSRQFALRGITCLEDPLTKVSDGEVAVIGGGHVITGANHVAIGKSSSGNPGRSTLNVFRPPGKHLMSSVGVRLRDKPDCDMSYLSEYRYLSARDSGSCEFLERSSRQEVHSVPCVASLSQSMHVNDVVSLHGFEWIRQRIGSYVVVHSDHTLLQYEIRDGIRMETQGWINRPVGGKMPVVPVSSSPYVVSGVISGARAVVTRSLHMAIFALSNRVPFCCIDCGDDEQTEKLRSYFSRAGIPQVMYSGSDPVKYAVGNITRETLDAVQAKEIESCTNHFDAMASLVNGNCT